MCHLSLPLNEHYFWRERATGISLGSLSEVNRDRHGVQVGNLVGARSSYIMSLTGPWTSDSVEGSQRTIDRK